MKRPSNPLLLTLLTLLFVNLAAAASRASFCKCTCKTNSTIIALDTAPDHPNIDPGTTSSFQRSPNSNPNAQDPTLPSTDTSPGSVDEIVKPQQRSCADCNRQFCLMYDLPKLDDCKAENRGSEDEIVATCFQRDSAKDQAVVYTFVVLTVGLLVWAGVRPYVQRRGDGQRQDSSGYEQVSMRQTGLGTG